MGPVARERLCVFHMHSVAILVVFLVQVKSMMALKLMSGVSVSFSIHLSVDRCLSMDKTLRYFYIELF